MTGKQQNSSGLCILGAQRECSARASFASRHERQRHGDGRDGRMYLDARSGEIRDLKLDTDGWFPLLVLSLDARQAEVGSHQVLFPTLSGGGTDR